MIGMGAGHPAGSPLYIKYGQIFYIGQPSHSSGSGSEPQLLLAIPFHQMLEDHIYNHRLVTWIAVTQEV